jgi:hypothetical protein
MAYLPRSIKSYVWDNTTNLRATVFKRCPELRHFLLKFSSVPSLKEVEPGQFEFGSKIFKSRSQAFQDIYVQATSMGHKFRHYLEIGSAHPEQASNTFALEKSGWTGCSIEINSDLVDEFLKIRQGHVICADALSLDYRDLLVKLEFPPQIGYLQIDIDPAEISLKCLTSIPFNDYRFAVITFEHDSYVSGRAVKNESRNFLQKMGYVLVRKDVEWAPGKPFEDWWVHPELVPIDYWKSFEGKGHLDHKSSLRFGALFT